MLLNLLDEAVVSRWNSLSLLWSWTCTTRTMHRQTDRNIK